MGGAALAAAVPYPGNAQSTITSGRAVSNNDVLNKKQQQQNAKIKQQKQHQNHLGATPSLQHTTGNTTS